MTAVHSLAQRAAQDRMQHALRGEDREEFAALQAAVTTDWSPRDAYERRWVMELVTSMWRQDRLRGLELAVLAAAEQESPPSEATVRKLGTFARYGARIDKDMAAALQALRTLRKRPDAWIDELQDGTCEPNEPITAAVHVRTRWPAARRTAATRPGFGGGADGDEHARTRDPSQPAAAPGTRGHAAQPSGLTRPHPARIARVDQAGLCTPCTLLI